MKRLLCNQQGSHMVELVACTPMIMLIIVLMLQFYVSGHALVVAEAAARDAARAAAVGENATAAASLVGAGYSPTVTGPAFQHVAGVGCTVSVAVTLHVKIIVLRAERTLPIKRTATMPAELNKC
jgi:putative exporter of polyketide antibiotics